MTSYAAKMMLRQVAMHVVQEQEKKSIVQLNTSLSQ